MIEICGICLEPMNETDQGELLPCKHRYHISCIREWHLHSNDFKCPTCRKESKSLRREHDDIEIDLKYWCNVSLIEEFAKLRLRNDDEQEAVSAAEEDEEEEDEEDVNDNDDQDTLQSEETGHQPQNINSMQEVELLQCALCGEIDDDITLYCESCETLFHSSCLNELLCEVGEKEWYCIECDGTLCRLRWNKVSSMVIRDSNVRIYDGRMRDKRSILTECIYNRFTQPYTISYEDKCRIQAYVRTELDEFYHRGSLSKDRYIAINKMVSRKLYGLSSTGFDPSRINYKEQARLSIREVM